MIPLFQDPAVEDTIDIYAGNGCFLIRRGQAPKRVLRFEPNGLAVYHQVTLRDEKIRLALRAHLRVISEQLDAFTHDDAPRAFSLATTGIRAQFGTPEAFINMVRAAYPAVYRPKTVQFENPVLVEGQVVQPVKMTDAKGHMWVALYPMQRQADGGWRINGCQLARLSGSEV